MSYNLSQYKLALGTRDNWGSIQNNLISALTNLDNELEIVRNNYPTLSQGLDSKFLSLAAAGDVLEEGAYPSIKLLLALTNQGIY